MKGKSCKSLWLAALPFCFTLAGTRSADAADGIGVYIGGAAGHSTIRNDQISLDSPYSVPARYDFDEHHTAWTLFLGVQPIRYLGAELGYVNLGDPHVTNGLQGLPLVADAKVSGETLFAVGHLPLPLPALDIYGKLGAAHLQTAVNATNLGHPICPNACSNIAWIPGTYRLDRTDTGLAYGAGAQVKVASIGIRMEYERFNQTGGDSDLLTLGLAWNF